MQKNFKKAESVWKTNSSFGFDSMEDQIEIVTSGTISKADRYDRKRRSLALHERFPRTEAKFFLYLNFCREKQKKKDLLPRSMTVAGDPILMIS